MHGDRLLSQAFLDTHPTEAGAILEGMPSAEVAVLFAEIPPRVAAAVLQHMASSAAAECLAVMAATGAAEVVATLPLDLAALLLRRLDSEPRARLLAAIPEEVAAPLAVLLRYPEGTAGALMDSRILALPQDVSVGEALVRVRRSARQVFEYLYVVNRNHELAGVLNLRELMLAPRSASLASVMHRNVVRVAARADREEIVVHPGWREFHALPVIDEAGVFLGAIRYGTLRRLEKDTESAGEGAAVTTALALGELCWSGLARVLTTLGTAVAPRVTGPNRGSRKLDGA